MNWFWSATTLGPFQQGKQLLEDSLGFDKQALHILVGFMVFFLVLLVFRRKIWLALLAVTVAALMGEVLDIYELIAIRNWGWEDIFWPWHYRDLIDTMAGPIIMAMTIKMWGGHHAEPLTPER
ncbi:hypothetical protein ACR9YC_03155 [Parasphingorhabdus sp. DH2-15]|uniref:hypothetical protein n=1 Tax=Parasphingorhabdus sp. DH2-15 TaxID=3444112 RepID=UPI003F68940C